MRFAMHRNFMKKCNACFVRDTAFSLSTMSFRAPIADAPTRLQTRNWVVALIGHWQIAMLLRKVRNHLEH